MSIWTLLFGTNDNSSSTFSNTTNIATINPASGLPMTDGMGSLDVAGNVFGTDSSHWESSASDSSWDSGSSFDSSSSWDSGSSFGSSSWD
jgi:hypothetical protein